MELLHSTVFRVLFWFLHLLPSQKSAFLCLYNMSGSLTTSASAIAAASASRPTAVSMEDSPTSADFAYRGDPILVSAEAVLICDIGTEISAVVTYLPDNKVLFTIPGTHMSYFLSPIVAGSTLAETQHDVLAHIHRENPQLVARETEDALDATTMAALSLLINNRFDAACSSYHGTSRHFRVVDVQDVRESWLRAREPPSAPTRPCTRSRSRAHTADDALQFTFENMSSDDDDDDDDLYSGTANRDAGADATPIYVS